MYNYSLPYYDPIHHHGCLMEARETRSYAAKEDCMSKAILQALDQQLFGNSLSHTERSSKLLIKSTSDHYWGFTKSFAIMT